jgi:hypothetical protein
MRRRGGFPGPRWPPRGGLRPAPSFRPSGEVGATGQNRRFSLLLVVGVRRLQLPAASEQRGGVAVSTRAPGLGFRRLCGWFGCSCRFRTAVSYGALQSRTVPYGALRGVWSFCRSICRTVLVRSRHCWSPYATYGAPPRGVYCEAHISAWTLRWAASFRGNLKPGTVRIFRLKRQIQIQYGFLGVPKCEMAGPDPTQLPGPCF